MKGSKKMEKKVYEKVLEENKIKRPILSNCIKAFLVGGSICLIGQVLLYLFEEKMGIKKTEASTLMYIVVVGVTAIMTGLGFTIMEVFTDKLDVKSRLNDGTRVNMIKQYNES